MNYNHNVSWEALGKKETDKMLLQRRVTKLSDNMTLVLSSAADWGRVVSLHPRALEDAVAYLATHKAKECPPPWCGMVPAPRGMQEGKRAIAGPSGANP
jgi:hypothetical protein